MKKRSKQQGISLLELIVALTLGLILLLTLARTYTEANRSSNERSTGELLDETARQIFERIGQDLRNAGYVDIFDQNGRQVAKLSDSNVQNNIGRVTTNNHTVRTFYETVFGEKPLEGTDQALYVRAQVQPIAVGSYNSLATAKDNSNNDTTGEALSCINQALNTTGRKRSVYFLKEYSQNSSLSELHCGDGTDENNLDGNGSQPIVDGIYDLRFRYLVTDETNETGATYEESQSGLYTSAVLDANGVQNTTLGWAGVVGVEVCVVVGALPLENGRESLLASMQTTIIDCEDNAVARQADDGHLYRRYKRTFSLPNMLYFTTI